MPIFDPTFNIRKRWNAEINARPKSRAELEEMWGAVWNHMEMRKKFNQFFFANPVLVCRRKSDGTKGTLLFQYSPRLYFRWLPFESEGE
jgi:hypothetical protein